MIDPPKTALEATVFRKLTLAAAAGAGYVMGAKAGKERYTQIEAKFREIAGMPAVQNATAAVKETASGVAESAKASVTDATSSSSSSSSSSTPDVGAALATGPPPPPARQGPRHRRPQLEQLLLQQQHAGRRRRPRHRRQHPAGHGQPGHQLRP